MLRLPRRVCSSARILLAALCCALATHAVLYRSLVPDDGVHGYLGWYELVVAGLSLAALLTLVAAVLLRAGGCRRGVLGSPVLARSDPFRSWARLAVLSLSLLLVQESVERSVAFRAPAVAVFPASSWLVLLAGAFLFAGVVVLLARTGRAIVQWLVARRQEAARGGFERSGTPLGVVLVRRSALAELRGLRAPPLLAV